MLGAASVSLFLQLTSMAAPPPVLCEVARARELDLFRLLDDTVLVAADGPAALCARDKPCARLPDDPTPGARQLIPAEAGRVVSAAGRWGEHLVLTRGVGMSEGTSYEVLELADGRWRARGDGERGWLPWYPRLVAADGGGQARHARIAGIAELASDGARATGRQLTATPPRPRVFAFDGTRSRTVMSFAPTEDPVDVLALADGQVLVLANRVEEGSGVPIVRRFSGRAGAAGVTERLPSPCAGTPLAGVDLDAFRIDGRRGDDVHVALGARCGSRRSSALAHFDGKRWTLTPGPEGERAIADLSVGRDGAIWLVAGGGLFRRAPKAVEWTRVSIAAAGQAAAALCTARQAIARDDGGVLVAATCAPSSAAGGQAGTTSARSSAVVFSSRCPSPSLGNLTVGTMAP